MRKYRMEWPMMFIGSIFAFFGVVTLAAGVFMTLDWIDFKKTAVEISATIVDIDSYRVRRNGKTKTRHDVFVEYEYDGITYDGKSDTYNSGMYVGDTITMYIDPENPENHKTNQVVPIIMMGFFSVIFGGIGFGFIVHQITKSIYINGLIARELYIYCEQWHEENSGTRVNNVRYKCAVAEYFDSYGRRLEFRSQPYHPNKCPFYPGQRLRVYVDLENKPTNYYVTTDEF